MLERTMPQKIRVLQCVVEADEGCHEHFERVRNAEDRQRMLRRWGSHIPHRHPLCEKRLLEIIRTIDWSNGDEGRIVRRYACYCIRDWQVAWRWPEPEDLISEALYRCMTGDRKLHYPTPKAFPGFLCFTMKSIARGEKEKSERRGEQSLMEENDFDRDDTRERRMPVDRSGQIDPIADLTTNDLLRAFLSSIDDPQMRAYVLSRRDHPEWEAEDHAHAMGVSVQDIYNLNRRLHRLRERWIRLGGSPPSTPRPRRRG
jgi:hypothetical protein